jgi:hypothetical protein
MTNTIPDNCDYAVPDSPADPEAAALDLIVRLPVEILRPEFPHLLTEVLQDYCGVLHAEGAFAGLSWADAKAIAAAVSFDAITRDDAADFLRNRARNVLAGTDNMGWQNRERAARALNIAATVLGL